MELSQRDAVSDRFISGPKNLSSGTLPALRPALTGVNRACVTRGLFAAGKVQAAGVPRR